VTNLIGWLGLAYPWVKAAHVTFVTFDGRALPASRFYVYHQKRPSDRLKTAPGSNARQGFARSFSPRDRRGLVPGLMLAAHLGIWDEHWFQAKLAWSSP
jgi:putative membrane protein